MSRASRSAKAKAVFGLGRGSNSHSVDTVDNTIDGTFAADTDVTTEATARATADTALVAALATFVVAGADNTTTHDYTATGVTASSTVFGAVAFKDQATVAAAIAGTITPGTDKITVAAGADLSAGFTLVFFVKK